MLCTDATLKNLPILFSDPENTTLIVCCSKARAENNLLKMFVEEIEHLDETLLVEAYTHVQKVVLAYLVEPQDVEAYEAAARQATAHLTKHKHLFWFVMILALPKSNQGLLYTRWHSIYFATTVNARITIISDDDMNAFSIKRGQIGKSVTIRAGRRLISLLLLHDLLLCDQTSERISCLFNSKTLLGQVFRSGSTSFFSPHFRLATAQGTFRSRSLFYHKRPWEFFLLYICQCYYLNTSIFRTLNIIPKNIANTFFPPTSPTFCEDVNATVLLLKKLQLLTPHMNFFYIGAHEVGKNPKGGGLADEYRKNNNHFKRMQITLSKVDRSYIDALPENAAAEKPNVITFKAASVKRDTKHIDANAILSTINNTLLSREPTQLALTLLIERLLD